MTYRFYYWFSGAPENRIGGPWWARDFDSETKMNEFKNTTLPFLCAWATEVGINLEKPVRVNDDIRPSRAINSVVPPKTVKIERK